VPVPIENTKIFVAQNDANYTGVVFFVRNRLLGKIYNLSEAKNATGMVSHAYNMEWIVRPQVEKEKAALGPTNRK